MFFKKSKVNFFCSLPEVLENYPITEAKKTKQSWLKKSASAYKSSLDEYGKFHNVSGVVKCPGVRPFMEEGYILRSWFDLTININENGLEYFTPSNINSYLEKRNFTYGLVDFFTPDNPNHMVPLPKNCLQALVKITTPWTVSIPKGIKILITPVGYSDHTDFECVHGVMNSTKTFGVNPILKINATHGTIHIPAGTPLMQMIPVYDDKPTVEILEKTHQSEQAEIESIFFAQHKFNPTTKK